mmetsp:Transcript_24034/g.41904  ORF Transcript_24034/g.41904 Transcript_24034/m.41904 type:complete len:90 (+) Transcript_24034:142-411(+)
MQCPATAIAWSKIAGPSSLHRPPNSNPPLHKEQQHTLPPLAEGPASPLSTSLCPPILHPKTVCISFNKHHISEESLSFHNLQDPTLPSV